MISIAQRAAGTMIWTFAGALLLALSPGMSASCAAADNTVTVTKSSTELRQVTARYAINAPPSFVWQTITSYPQLPSFIPAYRRCRVLSSQGAQKTLDVHMQTSRLLPPFRYQVRVNENPKAMNLSLKRISGDFAALNGQYKLLPVDNGERTLLIYHLSIDPGLALPGANGMIKSNVERELSAVRAHAEQAHRKSMIGAN